MLPLLAMFLSPDDRYLVELTKWTDESEWFKDYARILAAVHKDEAEEVSAYNFPIVIGFLRHLAVLGVTPLDAYLYVRDQIYLHSELDTLTGEVKIHRTILAE